MKRERTNLRLIKGDIMKTYKSPIVLIMALCFSIMTFNLPAQENKGFHDIITKLMQENKFDEAEKLALEKYKQFPNDPEVICALGCVYRNKSRKSALSVDFAGMGIKELPGAYKKMTLEDVEDNFKDTTYYEPEEHKKAEDLYFEIIQKAPDYKNAYFNLLNDYVEMERFTAYFQVIDLFVKNQRKSDQTPGELLDLAGKLLKKERYNEAIKLYGIILANYPNYTYAESDLGVAYAKQGKIYESLKHLKAVYDKDPNDFINIKSYFFDLILCEDFNTALKIATEKAQKAPEDDQFFHSFEEATIAYLLDKNYISLFKKSMEQCKYSTARDKDFCFSSANEFLSLKSKSKKDQINFLEFQLDQYQKNGYQELTIIIANILNKIETSDSAIMALGSVFDKNLFLVKTLEYLDKIRERKKIDDKIMSDYQMNYNYGRIYFVNEKYDQALSYFKKNFTLKQDNAYTNWLIGKCELSLGNKEEAKIYFTINKKLESKDKEQLKYINVSIWELRKLEE